MEVSDPSRGGQFVMSLSPIRGDGHFVGPQAPFTCVQLADAAAAQQLHATDSRCHGATINLFGSNGLPDSC